MKYAYFIFVFSLVFIFPAIFNSQPVFASTNISGNISSDTVWQTGEVYVVDGNVVIDSGAGLTIQPSVIVKFKQSSSLTVNGGLAINGTPAGRVYLTSFNDDSVGDDTNGDGPSAGSAGYWSQIQFNSGSNSSINYTTIRFGGSGIEMSSNLFIDGGVLTVSNSTISSSSNYGLHMANGSVTISNSIIRDNTVGIYAHGAGSLTLDGDTFIDNSDVAGQFQYSINTITSFGNTSSGTGKNAFYVYGQMLVDNSLTGGIPYLVDSIEVASGKTLTINPGTIIKFNQWGSLTVGGTLNSNGTPSSPIYFTSLKDDSIGGDNNNAGGTPAGYDWQQIRFNPGSTGSINNSVIRYGGSGFNINSNIYVNGGTVAISDSTVASSSFFGLLKAGGSVSITNSTIKDNYAYGVYNYTFGPIDAEDNYWGDSSGPTHPSNPGGTGDAVSDYVDFVPWLTSPPTPTSLKEPVLIIPGIIGTELKNGDDLIWADLNQMFWDIGDEFMTENLALDENGQPVNADVEIGQTIETILGGIPVVNINIFEGLKLRLIESGYSLGQDLFFFPYDWRLDLNDTASLLAERVEEIKTQTGSQKVNIIAHSMGGLLTKEYIRQEGKQSIDKLIFIGTPHLGAPKAGKALVEGDRFGIPWLEEDRIKEIAKNSIALHESLPNQSYFDITGEAYIKQMLPFGSYNFLDYDETKEFLIEQGSSPNVFNSAEEFFAHNLEGLDTSGVDVYNIAGCGVATQAGYEVNSLGAIKSIKYRKGDKTVPLISGDPTTMLSIPPEKRFFTTDGTHAELPSRPGVRDLIADILNDDQLVSYGNLSNDFSICGIRGKELIWRSPVEVHIYDSQGNHTGPIENNAIEYGIAGVDYEIIGHEKFIFLPTKNGEIYQVTANGLDIGTFDLIIHDNEDEILTGETVFNDVPVTTLTKVRFSVTDEQVDSIDVDRDGDGISDAGYLSDGGWIPHSATIQSTLDDLERVYLLDWIDGEVKNSLESLLKATLSTETTTKSKGKQADSILGVAFLNKLESGYNGDRINQQAYNILKKDIEWLLK